MKADGMVFKSHSIDADKSMRAACRPNYQATRGGVLRMYAETSITQLDLGRAVLPPSSDPRAE